MLTFYSINGVHDELRNIKEDNSLIPNMARDIHPSVSYQNAVLKLFYDSYINNKQPEMFDFSKKVNLLIQRNKLKKFGLIEKLKTYYKCYIKINYSQRKRFIKLETISQS